MKTFLLSIGTLFICCATLVAEQPSNPSHATAPLTQTINTIASFANNSGQPDYPTGVLAQGFSGNLYGAAQGSGFGTIYQITPAGAVSTLHVFDVNNDGYDCFYGVSLGRDGNLYGTCQNINSGTGSVWTLNLTTGAFTRLHIFTGPDGIDPLATLTQGADGNFYGTVNSTTSGNPGAVFKITPTGTFTTIHTFAGGPNDGGFPTGVLFLSRDGNFYGVTSSGGPTNQGS